MPVGIVLSSTLLYLFVTVAIDLHKRAADEQGRKGDWARVGGVYWDLEGELNFHVTEQQKGKWAQWFYSESLETRWRPEPEERERLYYFPPRAEMEPIDPGNVEVLRSRIIPFGIVGSENTPEGMRRLWWNGPRGQVDYYAVSSRLRVSSLAIGEEAVPAPGRPSGRVELLHVPWNRLVDSVVALLVTPGRIYEIPKVREELRSLYVMPGGRPVTALGVALLYEPHPKYGWGNSRALDQWLFLRSGDQLSRLDREGKVICELRVPAEAGQNMVIRTLKEGGYGIRARPARDWDGSYLCLLYDQEGKLLRRVDVDLAEISRKLGGRGASPVRATAPALFPPLPGLMDASALIQSLILVLALAGVVMWHQRRSGQVGWRRIAWPVFVAGTSLFGFACYWLAHRDGVTEPCPECGRNRPVDRDTCPHCQTTWPKWEPLGVEIFDGGGAVQ